MLINDAAAAAAASWAISGVMTILDTAIIRAQVS
jgi:hypothetical protein